MFILSNKSTITIESRDIMRFFKAYPNRPIGLLCFFITNGLIVLLFVLSFFYTSMCRYWKANSPHCLELFLVQGENMWSWNKNKNKGSNKEKVQKSDSFLNSLLFPWLLGGGLLTNESTGSGGSRIHTQEWYRLIKI